MRSINESLRSSAYNPVYMPYAYSSIGFRL